jgi:hypothetical protein
VVAITDHAAHRYANRYERNIGLDEARSKLGIHIMKSSARRLPTPSSTGDPLMLLPELDCVVVIKPDEREGHEGDLVVPTVLENPDRKVNRGPMYDKIAAMSDLRAKLPAQAPTPPAPKPKEVEPAPAPTTQPPPVDPVDRAELDRLRWLRGQVDGLVTTLRKREQHIRVSVAGLPENVNLQAWADRQMTLAVEVGAIGDEIERFLEQCDRV